MNLRTALLAASVLAAPALAGPAWAQAPQPVAGPYMSLGAGVNMKMDLDVKTPGADNLQFHLGPAVVGAFGYGFGNGFRAEIEGNYYNNQAYKVGGSSAYTAAGGREQLYGVMVNGYYDFNGLVPMVTPYVGIGAGYQFANWQNVKAYGPAGSFATDETKGSFAAQAIVGAALPIDAVPGLALTAEYRFMALIGDRTYSGSATSSTGVVTPDSVKVGNDYNNTFLIGVRYAFGVTPPPPPPAPAPVAAPAPAPARSYLVFFDWDKATLTSSRPRDRQGSGGQLDPRPVHADRGERLHRYLRPGEIQHGPVDPPRRRSGGGAGARRRAQDRHRDPGLRRNPPVGAHRRQRAGAAEPPGRDHHQVRPVRHTAGLTNGAPSGAPFSL